MKLASIDLDGQHAGITLAYVDWGTPSAERVILCVHGVTRNSRDFDFLAAALANCGARVVAVDVVGRGHSSWLSDPRKYRVTNYANQLRHFHQLLRFFDSFREDPNILW